MSEKRRYRRICPAGHLVCATGSRTPKYVRMRPAAPNSIRYGSDAPRRGPWGDGPASSKLRVARQPHWCQPMYLHPRPPVEKTRNTAFIQYLPSARRVFRQSHWTTVADNPMSSPGGLFDSIFRSDTLSNSASDRMRLRKFSPGRSAAP